MVVQPETTLIVVGGPSLHLLLLLLIQQCGMRTLPLLSLSGLEITTSYVSVGGGWISQLARHFWQEPAIVQKKRRPSLAAVCFLPSETLWKSFLALAMLYSTRVRDFRVWLFPDHTPTFSGVHSVSERLLASRRQCSSPLKSMTSSVLWLFLAVSLHHILTPNKPHCSFARRANSGVMVSRFDTTTCRTSWLKEENVPSTRLL